MKLQDIPQPKVQYNHQLENKVPNINSSEVKLMHFNLHNKVYKTIFNIGKPMTHKTRKIVKFITVLHYLTNLHHVISKTA